MSEKTLKFQEKACTPQSQGACNVWNDSKPSKFWNDNEILESGNTKTIHIYVLPVNVRKEYNLLQTSKAYKVRQTYD